jgi:nicotinamidase-related amidase
MALDDLSTRAVVLVIDHLDAVAPMGRTAPAKQVDLAAAALVNAAKLFDIPIVASGISMRGVPKLTPAVREALRGVQLHVRQTTDSFDDAAIRDAIESSGRRSVLIAGIITEIAVQRAALGGKERGFDTRVVLDACNGASERSEVAAVHRMNHSGVVLSSVPAVIGELATDFADSRTQKLFGLFPEL